MFIQRALSKKKRGGSYEIVKRSCWHDENYAIRQAEWFCLGCVAEQIWVWIKQWIGKIKSREVKYLSLPPFSLFFPPFHHLACSQSTRASVRRLSNYVLMSADMIRFIFSQFAIGGGEAIWPGISMQWRCYITVLPKNKKGHSIQNTIVPFFLSFDGVNYLELICLWLHCKHLQKGSIEFVHEN